MSTNDGLCRAIVRLQYRTPGHFECVGAMIGAPGRVVVQQHVLCQPAQARRPGSAVAGRVAEDQIRAPARSHRPSTPRPPDRRGESPAGRRSLRTACRRAMSCRVSRSCSSPGSTIPSRSRPFRFRYSPLMPRAVGPRARPVGVLQNRCALARIEIAVIAQPGVQIELAAEIGEPVVAHHDDRRRAAVAIVDVADDRVEPLVEPLDVAEVLLRLGGSTRRVRSLVRSSTRTCATADRCWKSRRTAARRRSSRRRIRTAPAVPRGPWWPARGTRRRRRRRWSGPCGLPESRSCRTARVARQMSLTKPAARKSGPPGPTDRC